MLESKGQDLQHILADRVLSVYGSTVQYFADIRCVGPADVNCKESGNLELDELGSNVSTPVCVHQFGTLNVADLPPSHCYEHRH